LKHRLPAKLLPLVEEYLEKLEKLTAEQGRRLTPEKGYDPKELRRVLKAAATTLHRADPVPLPRGGWVAERGRRGGRPKGVAAAAGA
jgi:hypothetical protein